MKLLRYGPAGQEKPGILAADGEIRDLSGIIPDLAGEALLPESIEKLRKVDLWRLPDSSSTTSHGALRGERREIRLHWLELFRSR